MIITQPRACLLLALAALPLVLAACAGGDNDRLPTPEEVASANDPADIPMEPYPQTLPEAFILRDAGFAPQEDEARSEITYIVQPGDSLAAIAARFGVDTTDLQRINGIVDPSVLRAGDELRVPVVAGTEAERIAATLDSDADEADSAAPPPGEEYVIEPGDNLFDIGVRFGVSYLDLQNYNRLTDFEAANLQVGDTIIIPPPDDAPEDERTEPPG